MRTSGNMVLVGFVPHVARHGGGSDSDGDPARRLHAAAEGVVLVVQAARAECGGAEPALVETPPLSAEAPPEKRSEQSRHG